MILEHQDKGGGNTEQAFHFANAVCASPEQPDYIDALRGPEKRCIDDLGWAQTPVTCPSLALHSCHLLPLMTAPPGLALTGHFDR